MMFVFKEAGYQLFRNRWRSVILILASAMLCGCVAFYLGSIGANERALAQLAQTVSVKMYVVDVSGAQEEVLAIQPKQVDALSESPYLKDIQLRALAAGAIGEEARAEDPFVGGDLMITAANSFDALGASDGELVLGDGFTEDALQGDEPVCFLDAHYAQAHGLSIGGTVELPVYVMYWRYRLGGWYYYPLGTHELTIAGNWTSSAAPREMVVPVAWLRKIADRRPTDSGNSMFIYSSCSATIKDTMELDAFKATVADMGFIEPDAGKANTNSGEAVMVSDEQFITSAERLIRNIGTFRRMLVPFFILIAGLVVMVVLLVLRGARRDMAIASSLGRPKALIAAAHMIAAFSAELAGGLLVLPVMLIAGTGAGAAVIMGAFLLCSLLGDLAGVWGLLRFDALGMLLRAE